MTLAAALLLGVLALINRYIGKSFLYPPAFYSAWWCVLLLALVLCGEAFYPLSFQTLAIFIVGATTFSAGGLVYTLASRRRHGTQSSAVPPYPRKTLAFTYAGLTVLAAGFPFYLQKLEELRLASYFTDFWRGVRQQTSTGLPGESGFGGFEYLMVFASFLSLLATFQNDGSRAGRLRAIAVVGITLVYDFLTASRLAAMTTIFSIVALSWLRSARINWKLWIVGAVLFAVVFTAPAILLEKGGGLGLTFTENATGVLDSLEVYTVGGLVAFDQAINDLSVFPPGLSLRFFWAVASALKFHVQVPGIVLPFTATPSLTNVYTIYGSYFADFGWPGVAVFMTLLGAGLTWLYRRARRGHPEAVILYSVAIAGLMMSAATDGFLLSLSAWVQTAFFTFLAFRWPCSRPATRWRAKPAFDDNAS